MISASPATRISDLDSLVALSEHMLAKGRAGEWEGMESLVSQRLSLLQLVLAPQVAAREAEEVAARLQRILALDHELTALAASARDESAAQVRQLRNGQSASAAYNRFDTT